MAAVRALMALPDQGQNVCDNQPVAGGVPGQRLDQLGILTLVSIHKPGWPLFQLRLDHRAAGRQHSPVHRMHPVAHGDMDQAGHAVFPPESRGRQAQHVPAIKGRHHIGEQAGRNPMALVDHQLTKVLGQAIQIVLGRIDDGHGHRPDLELAVTGQTGLNPQKLLNALLPLVHQFLGVHQDQGRLPPPGNHRQGHDGLT